ncbi:hypothetical protein C8F01DRAFT_774947 [Mycena amicta]|nr:hypothetical protein C8F01DRAFT_774947 [Mycena amicta]
MDLSVSDVYLPPSHTQMSDPTPYAPTTDTSARITLVTLKTLLADRKFTAERPRQQPPSFIFRLPPELLAEVFLTLTAEDLPASTTFLPMHWHLVISKVCGLWRAVALHSPILWCRIVLHLGRRTSGFGGIKNLAHTCFQRSHELPLSLIITSESLSIPNLVMDLVLPARHRIRHLQLRIPVAFTESIFKLPRSALKALRTIDVSAMMLPDDTGLWFRAMSALEGATQLERVVLRCLSVEPPRLHEHPGGWQFIPIGSGLPWAQLLHLSLLEDLQIRYDDAIHVIEQAPNLIRLALHIVPAAADTSKQDPVSAPALRIFEMTVSGTGATHVLDALILPSLEELSIRCKEHLPIPYITLVALQRRSSFSLRRLLISNPRMDNILPFLESNPLLERLQLFMCGLSLKLLCVGLTLPRDAPAAKESEALALAAGVVNALPRLQELALADRWTDERPTTAWSAATRALMDMVRSRRRADTGASSPLKNFVFGAEGSLSPKKVARLKVWRSEGMDLRLIDLRPGYERFEGADCFNG